MVRALILIGAPGAGKSSVLDALSTLLELDRVEHGAIESEELSRGWPLLAGAQWTDQLDAALALHREAGRRLFLIVATVESDVELGAVVAAARAERCLLVCLGAQVKTLEARLAEREPDRWPGKDPLIVHARELAAVVAGLDRVDVVLDTEDRDAEAVAGDILGEMQARGLVSAPGQ